MSDGTINLRGKKYITFAGLLDRFHHHMHQGGNFYSIDTKIVPGGIPAADNNNTAIVRAEVCEYFYTAESAKEIIRRTSGIGDANPQNVSKNIVPHIIRMAETRAKSRALRDFLNAEGEEFEGEYAQEDTKAARSQSRSSGEMRVIGRSDKDLGEHSLADGGVADEFNDSMDDESESRKAVLDELVSNAKKLGFNNQQISKKLESHWLEANLVDLEESASRMRMAVEDKEKSIAERGE